MILYRRALRRFLFPKSQAKQATVLPRQVGVEIELGKHGSSMTLVSQVQKDLLAKAGISTLHAAPFGLADTAIFEPPCSIKWMGTTHSLYIGAFSYAVSGYYFATRILRYVSIGEDVQIGRGNHPVDWAATSPVFYQNYRDVLDLDCHEANGFRPDAPYIGYKETTIGNDVYVGHGALIMQGVTIGDGAIIGARSVVTKDVPAYSIVAGSPAVVKRMRFSDAIIERFTATQWSQYAFWDLQDAPVSQPERFLDFVDNRKQKGLVPYAPKIVTASELFGA